MIFELLHNLEYWMVGETIIAEQAPYNANHKKQLHIRHFEAILTKT